MYFWQNILHNKNENSLYQVFLFLDSFKFTDH